DHGVRCRILRAAEQMVGFLDSRLFRVDCGHVDESTYPAHRGVVLFPRQHTDLPQRSTGAYPPSALVTCLYPNYRTDPRRTRPLQSRLPEPLATVLVLQPSRLSLSSTSPACLQAPMRRRCSPTSEPR